MLVSPGTKSTFKDSLLVTRSRDLETTVVFMIKAQKTWLRIKMTTPPPTPMAPRLFLMISVLMCTKCLERLS